MQAAAKGPSGSLQASGNTRMSARSRCFFCYSLYLMACWVPPQGAYAPRVAGHTCLSSPCQRFRIPLVFCGLASKAYACGKRVISSPLPRSRIPRRRLVLLATALASREGRWGSETCSNRAAGALVRYSTSGRTPWHPAASAIHDAASVARLNCGRARVIEDFVHASDSGRLRTTQDDQRAMHSRGQSGHS